MTVKNVFNCRKQNVGRERLEQVLVPTRNEADVLLRITRHLDDRRTDYLSNDSDFGITAVWENAVDDSYIYMRPSQNPMRRSNWYSRQLHGIQSPESYR